MGLTEIELEGVMWIQLAQVWASSALKNNVSVLKDETS
jgi:hypothetical protein